MVKLKSTDYGMASYLVLTLDMTKLSVMEKWKVHLMVMM